MSETTPRLSLRLHERQPETGDEGLVTAFWRLVAQDLATGIPTPDSGYPTADDWLESEAFEYWVSATLPESCTPELVRAALRSTYGGNR